MSKTASTKRTRKPTAVSLFTGCGGSDAGLIEAGFDVLMANDVLSYARDFYVANLPETEFVLGDVTRIESFPSCDLLVGCYPCQGFSQGGAREAGRTINYLYREFGRALRQCKPKAFIVENVSGMVRSDFQHLLRNKLKNFRHAGYDVNWQVLNAADYGVPQERKRIIIVGIHKKFGVKYTFPHPTHGAGSPNAIVTIRDAIADLPKWPVGEFNVEPFHWYYMSRNRKRRWNQTSLTIVSHARSMPLHPCSPDLESMGPDAFRFVSSEPARRFSYPEAARLQGFWPSLVWPETRGMPMRYRVIGNAVPPPLFSAVAKALPDLW
jgi:DNA (cytosine-5)-methyltransferase 1